MTDTVNLGLPCIEGSQAQKHVTHNEALHILDTLVQLAVLDRDLTAPPGSPAEGQRWIVKTGATGAWAGHVNAIAAWQDGAWQFSAPQTGWLAYVVDEGALLAWSGSAWVDAISAITSLNNMTLIGLGTTADATNPLSAKLNNTLFTARSVAEGGDGNLRYKLSKESAAKALSFLFQDNYSGRAEIGLTGDDDFHFKVSPDGSTWRDALVIDRSTGLLRHLGQLAFPATQNPSSDANTLDDYEEGTFTPTLTTSGTVPTGVTYSTQSGVFTKIGRAIAFKMRMTLTSKGSGGTGNVRIAGLPFAAGGGDEWPLSVRISAVTLDAGYTMFGAIVSPGQSYMQLEEYGSAISVNTISWGGLSNSSSIFIAGYYSV